jgi:hypothetical protein
MDYFCLKVDELYLLQDLVPCVLLSFEFEHILMWRENEWKPSLPLVKETNLEVTEAQEHFSGKELNETVRSSGTVLTQIKLADNERSHTSCSLGEGGEPKCSMKPILASDIPSSSATVAPGLANSVGKSGTEPSAHTPVECSPSNSGSDFVDSSLKSVLHNQTILSDKCEKGGLVDESFNNSASSGHSPDALEPSLGVTSIDDGLEMRKDSKNIIGGDILNSGSKLPSYMEGVVLLLKQAVDNGSAIVLSEIEFVDYNLVYQKSVELAKSAPRGPVFGHTQRGSNVRRNGPDKHQRIKKHLVGKKVSGHVEKKENGNGGLAIQTNDHTQEFLSEVVPQGTLRVDELAKLLS